MKYIIVKNQYGVRLYYPLTKKTLFYVGYSDTGVYVNFQTPNCISAGFRTLSNEEAGMFINTIIRFINKSFTKYIHISERYTDNVCIYNESFGCNKINKQNIENISLTIDELKNTYDDVKIK